MRTTRPGSSRLVSKQQLLNETEGGADGIISGFKSGIGSSFWSAVHSNGASHRAKGVPSGSSTSTTASSSSLSSSNYGTESDLSDHVKEWEEELLRIEIRSRHSSDLLGFSGRRKRSTGVPRVTTAIPGLDA